MAEFVYHQLACYQHLHPDGFDVVDMHKNIGPVIIKQDEAKPAIRPDEVYMLMTCAEPWYAWPILIDNNTYFELAVRSRPIHFEIDPAELTPVTAR